MITAFALGLVVVAPPLNYGIPLLANSFLWGYLVVAAGLFGMLLLTTRLHPLLKALNVCLFISCFFSQAPAFSFNAYMVIVATFWAFLGLQEVDYRFILNIAVAAFWLEVAVVSMQLIGHDKLLCFDRAMELRPDLTIVSVSPNIPKFVFLGTVFQYMRMSSVFAILTPFLILKNRWYVIPVMILCVVSKSSSFALSVIAGIFVYAMLTTAPENRKKIVAMAFLAVCAYALWDRVSFVVAFTCGRWGVWGDIWTTWYTNTLLSKPVHLTGPFVWKTFLWGHGIDTFLPLFPIYKHDPNPFNAAHNCWLQLLWEIGLIMTGNLAWYCAVVIKRLYRLGYFDAIAGLTCIGVNMFFAFPTRMTQTVFLMVAFMAICNRVAFSRLLKPEETL